MLMCLSQSVSFMTIGIWKLQRYEWFWFKLIPFYCLVFYILTFHSFTKKICIRVWRYCPDHIEITKNLKTKQKSCWDYWCVIGKVWDSRPTWKPVWMILMIEWEPWILRVVDVCINANYSLTYQDEGCCAHWWQPLILVAVYGDGSILSTCKSQVVMNTWFNC
jgi:hypothetical protein